MTYLTSGSGAKQIKIQILFDDDHLKPKQVVEKKKGTMELVQFAHDEAIKGKVVLEMANPRKNFPYNALKLELVSQIEMNTLPKPHVLITNSVDISGPNTITGQKLMFPFEFSPLNQYESYSGKMIKLRYFLRLSILAKVQTPSVEQEFALTVPQQPSLIQPINQQLGIEKLIHVDLQLNKNAYSLSDIIMGSLYIRLLRLEIQEVYVNFVRAEMSGRPLQEKNRVVVHTYQLADGQIVKGDVLPIRLFLKHIPLTPSLSNVADLFGVNYYLTFDFVDNNKMKYTSTVEVQLYRENKPGSVQQEDVRMVPPINIVNLEQLTDVNLLYCHDDEPTGHVAAQPKAPVEKVETEQIEKEEVVAPQQNEEIPQQVEEVQQQPPVQEQEVLYDEVQQEEKKKSSSSSSSSSSDDKKDKVENTIDDFIF